MKKKLALLLVMVMVLAFTPVASADQHVDAETATVSITLSTSENAFGETEMWEASLYEGAVAGEETSGRFTDWKTVEDGSVSFDLPMEVREDDEAPWGAELDTYVRVRTVGEDGYPDFDLVSTPFTLNEGADIDVSIGLNTEINMVEDQEDGEAVVAVSLYTGSDGFGETDEWEASLYEGAVTGEETSGRFTDWKVAEEGVVEFVIPEEVREDNEAPWNVEMDTYLRVRSIDDDAYPLFDMVSAPFTLGDGMNYSVNISLVSVAMVVEDVPELEIPVVPEEPTDPDASIEVMMWINQTDYTINDEPGTADVAPFIQDGRTMVPISFVARAMNLDSDWGPRGAAAEWVSFEGNNMRIELEIGSTEIAVWENGVERTETSDVAAQIVDGRTVLPLRAVGEILGADFNWGPKDAATEWVSFTYTPTAVIEEPLQDEEEASIDWITATPDYEENSLTIAGAVTGDVDMVSIGVGALRWVDERDYEDDARGHQGFDIPVEEDGSFSITLVEGGSWPGGDNWHGLRSGTHQVRAAILDDEGEIVSFVDSEEFTVE
ncbi:Copper amine oxidase N-terminal domain-containing protein [Tindallia magadiensis]|uniref:Copper amine oxidase N-terminal domain-containing protein n=1 Tax=Tindallia magadiensis TaxID=69895 RepID=A0A1I3BYB4_9FIRM|nr:copper amine oxidase N-terminal domain-containing protein [Tindallia magadiensis]SFH67232.1 Copper amine oxidase N-terminal domain-containing protein [Tindallia magadiensis]